MSFTLITNHTINKTLKNTCHGYADLSELPPVGSTNVKNVTTLRVVFSPRQMSQHQSQHQQQTSNNDKRHRGFSSKNDKRQNVTK